MNVRPVLETLYDPSVAVIEHRIRGCSRKWPNPEWPFVLRHDRLMAARTSHWRRPESLKPDYPLARVYPEIKSGMALQEGPDCAHSNLPPPPPHKPQTPAT